MLILSGLWAVGLWADRTCSVLCGQLPSEVRFEWWIKGEERARAMSLILPPFNIPSSSARALWGRWHSKPMGQMNNFHRALLRTAQNSGGLAVHFHNCDDASSNDLFFAAEHSSEPDAWIRDRGYCGNHNTQHTVQWLVTTVFTMTFISTLFRTTTFLAMGTHIYRFVLHVPAFVQQPDRVVFKTGIPSPEETTYAATIQDPVGDKFGGSLQTFRRTLAAFPVLPLIDLFVLASKGETTLAGLMPVSCRVVLWFPRITS